MAESGYWRLLFGSDFWFSRGLAPPCHLRRLTPGTNLRLPPNRRESNQVSFPRDVNALRGRGWMRPVRKVGKDSMKAKTRVELMEEARRREVEHEILSYFLAVESYPARVAQDPQVSFERHCWSVYTELEIGRAN